MFRCKHHAVQLFLQNEHTSQQQESLQHVRNIVQQGIQFLVIQNALRSIEKKRVNCIKGRAHTITPLMMVIVFSPLMFDHESGAYRSGTQVTPSFLSLRNHVTLFEEAKKTQPSAKTKLYAEYAAALNKEWIEEHLIQQEIRWKFSQPTKPHFGRVWELFVRSCKKTMYVMFGLRSVTEEDF